MKKSQLKEFVIASIAATVAGYLVKKGRDFFLETEFQKVKKSNKKGQDRSLLDSSQGLANQTVDVAEDIKKSPAQQGLIATLAYAATVFTLTKFLRKVI